LNDTIALGGSEIGGSGGGKTIAPTAGANGTGSGGGGGSARGGLGAKGGDGIVIVRFFKPAIAPTVKTGLQYTGEEISALEEEGSNWEIVSGSTNETNVGTYQFTIKPKTGLKWKDNGGEEERGYSWAIDTTVILENDVPQALNLFYSGSEQIGVRPSSSPYYTLSGETNTAAGTYTATATLNNPPGITNCTWPDGSTNNLSITYTIGAKIVDRPTVKENLWYTGSEQSGINETSSTLYDLTGTLSAINAGEYIATAVLKDSANYVWRGESIGKESIEIRWTIASKKVAPLEIAFSSFVYDGSEKFISISSIGWGEYTEISGSTNATEVGKYSFRAILKNPSASARNFVWQDGTSNDIIFEWEILPYPVEPPVAIENLKYTGTPQLGIEDSKDISKYSMKSGSKSQTVADEYNAVFSLNDTVNFTWKDGTKEDITVNWSIAKAENAITTLKIGSWKAEETPVEHAVRAEALWAARGEPRIEYSQSELGPWTENQPTNVGVHFVRATVRESNNWLGAQKIVKFSIWSDPDKIFRDYVDIRVQGYTGSEPLTNFPLLVRISEERMRGFYYSRAGLTGEQLVFMDEGENSLPYEVDKWDITGESYVWVKLNVLTNNAPIRMYWALKKGVMPPGYTPEEVWADYAGVWHFSESISGSESKAVPSIDATGNSNFAWPVNYNPHSTISRMRSYAGILGNARQIETTEAVGGGCHLVVSNNASLNLAGKFTISGWMKAGSFPGINGIGQGKVWPFAAREGEEATEAGFGAFIGRSNTQSDDLRYLRVFGAGNLGSTAQISSQPIYSPQSNSSVWVYFGVAYNGERITVGGSEENGAVFHETSIPGINEVIDYSSNIAFGNIPGTNTTYASLCGIIDEYRLAKLQRSEEWLKADYKTIDDDLFCTNSLVVKDGLKVNYWLDYPAFAPLAIDEGGEADVIYNGVLAEGWASTNYVNIYDSTTNSLFPLTVGSYRVVFALDESFKGYELLESEKGIFNLTVRGKTPYNAIQGTNGDSGRVLLMNRSGPRRKGAWHSVSRILL
jgi:hypothetical protein